MPSNYLQSLLKETLRITVTDKRSFTGQFLCVDRDGSAILSDTYESRQSTLERSNPFTNHLASETVIPASKSKQPERFVGLVVIPGKHITKIEHRDDSTMYS